MKSTEPIWFRKYRDDYLSVANILKNSDAKELVSKMEWFEDKISSNNQGNSLDLLRSVSFQNRSVSTEGDRRRAKLFFYKIKNSKYPNLLFSLSLLINLFLRDCQKYSLINDYNSFYFYEKITKTDYLAKTYDINHLLNKLYLFFDLLSIEEKIYILNFIFGSNDSDVNGLILKFNNFIRFAFKKASFNNWFLDTSFKLEYVKDGQCEYLSSNNLSIFFDLNKNCLRAANTKSYFLDDDFDSFCQQHEYEKLVVSYFIAKPGQIKVFKDIDVLSLEGFNVRNSLDFLGEIFEEYLNRLVCEDCSRSEYFLKEIFSKYPDVLMEIIQKDSSDIFENNLNKFINSETCKISLLRHGGNLPVYVDLKEDDHTKYHHI